MTGNDIYIHPTSVISKDCTLGKGTKIWHFSHIREGALIGKNVTIGQNVYIDKDVSIGDNCKIQNNVSIYKGVTLGNFVYVGPSVVFTNDLYPNTREWGEEMIVKTFINDEASLGANSTVLPGITVGKYSLIGANSLVTKDIPDHCLAYGSPAEIIDDSYRK